MGELAHEAVDVFRSDNPVRSLSVCAHVGHLFFLLMPPRPEQQNEGPKDPKVEEAVALAKAHRLAMLDAVRQEATTAEEKA